MRKNYINSFTEFININESIKLAIQQYEDRIDKNVFDQLINIDPSDTKKYLPFMCKLYIEEGIPIEDIKSTILKYDYLYLKDPVGRKDIDFIKSFDELKAYIKELESTPVKSLGKIKRVEADIIKI